MVSLPSPTELAKLNLDDPAELAKLDEAGLTAAPGETAEEYRQRLLKLTRNRRRMAEALARGESVNIASGLKGAPNMAIPASVARSAAERCRKLYAVSPSWAAGFYLTEPLGWLWGGSSWATPAEGEAVLVIRREFKTRERWFIYDRDELLAHEMCHVVRAPLGEERLEEHFAYLTGRSGLRRAFGNAFVYWYDPWVFMLPSLLMLAMQLANTFAGAAIPMTPFWILTFAGPGWLLWRSGRAKAVCRRAAKTLEAAQVKAVNPILFRLTFEELKTLEALPPEKVRGWFENSGELRFKVIKRRFLNGE